MLRFSDPSPDAPVVLGHLARPLFLRFEPPHIHHDPKGVVQMEDLLQSAHYLVHIADVIHLAVIIRRQNFF